MDLKPVVEVLIFRASEAYRSDQTVIYPAFDIVGDWKGSLGMYHGYLTQGYSLVVWETLKDHEDLMHSDKNAQLREDMGKCIDGSATMFHAYFQPSTNLGRVLDAPVTSVGQVKLKQESTHSNLDAVMKLLIEAQGIKGFRGAVYGKEVETDEFAFMTAWDSIEVRWWRESFES
ncbi:hypothetical protein DENSPDRAFT_853158 [Dentipellis sp. KUC8613]|nr:hypothetical protein DENSPDRAFT_853158 [Dentipellis sp. KUC8613]